VSNNLSQIVVEGLLSISNCYGTFEDFDNCLTLVSSNSAIHIAILEEF